MLDKTSEAVATTEIVLAAGDLHDALRRVRHAISKEETRYYLCGVYLHYVTRDNLLRFVATDGHRLAVADIPAPQGTHNIRAVILSRAFVTDAIRATNKPRDAHKQVCLALGPNDSFLTPWDGWVIEGALVHGTFPDYERVIPLGEPQHGRATLSREPFMQAVAAATAFAEGAAIKDPALRFAFAGGSLTVSTVIEGCGSDCRGSASAVVGLSATTMPAPRDIGFRGAQVLDILRSLRGQHVRFDFFDMDGPNNFAGDPADGGALHVIMPVRV